MSNKIYDILKYICMIVVPAVMTCFGTIAVALQCPYTEIILLIIGALNTCLGTCLGISTLNYNKKEDI